MLTQGSVGSTQYPMNSQQLIQQVNDQFRPLAHTQADLNLDLVVHSECLLSSCVPLE